MSPDSINLDFLSWPCAFISWGCDPPRMSRLLATTALAACLTYHFLHLTCAC